MSENYGVLVKGEWMEWVYQMNVWVKHPYDNAELCLDEDDIKLNIPELIKNGKIQYHKVSLINLLKLKDVIDTICVLETKNISLTKQIRYIWVVLVVLFALIVRLLINDYTRK